MTALSQNVTNKISKILLVEDDFNIRFVTSEFLRLSNYDVCCAENGKAALDILGNRSFDLVLTDVMMPIMNGAELVRIIRSLKGETFPVIVVSGSDIDSVVLHENRYTRTMRKPFPFEQLMQNIYALEETLKS